MLTEVRIWSVGVLTLEEKRGGEHPDTTPPPTHHGSGDGLAHSGCFGGSQPRQSHSSSKAPPGDTGTFRFLQVPSGSFGDPWRGRCNP